MMKTEVVRARIESELKAQAAAVLAANGLEFSDAIRLFLRQVVRKGGLPFPVRYPGVRHASGEQLWEMKRVAQKRDRELVAAGKLSVEDLMLVKPDALRGVRIQWPKTKLSD
jgi:addiction module RelB/DinJ family antitoxin